MILPLGSNAAVMKTSPQSVKLIIRIVRLPMWSMTNMPKTLDTISIKLHNQSVSTTWWILKSYYLWIDYLIMKNVKYTPFEKLATESDIP